MARVLAVDDEAGIRESLRMLLKRDCEVETADSVDAALVAYQANPPDLILLDLVMPERSGLDLLAELEERGNRAPVIVLTATKTVATAVEAMKRGASDYITKPFELEALRIKVRQLLEHRALQDEVLRLRDEVTGRQQLGGMIGRCDAMQEVFRQIERVARVEASVLLSGESGTGKELAARAIHDLSPRSEGPFVAVNCGAIPEGLIESELFGHQRGAFTGAVADRIGRFESANHGTLFLDEIGELEPNLQVKLLRALQERVIERLGTAQPVPIDVRVVAATHRDLERDVGSGRFRADLFYRINVVPISLPPLRERREDIRILADALLARISERSDRRARFGADTLPCLERYGWPGNVRELENAIEHGLALADSEVIDVADLPSVVARAGESEALREEWRSGRVGFEEAVERFESQMLLEALVRHDWNQTRAAGALGITRRSLKLKMDRFQLEPPAGKGE